MPQFTTALIVGAGHGLSASLARLFSREGMRVAVAARNVEKLAALREQTGACAFACEAVEPDQVARLFEDVERQIGNPEVVVYNASARARGPLVDLVPADVESALAVGAFGGFLVAQQAARRMLPKGAGAILLTGRVGEREGLSAVGAVRDGQVRAARAGPEHGARVRAAGRSRRAFRDRRRDPQCGRIEPPDKPDSMLDPDAIAQTYLYVLRQPRSAWTWEVELRPWVERF